MALGRESGDRAAGCGALEMTKGAVPSPDQARQKKSSYAREYRRKHPKRARAFQRAAMQRWRKKHPERVKAITKETYDRMRTEVLWFYSFGEMRCECCGWEDDDGPNPLELDHVAGGFSYKTKVGPGHSRIRGIQLWYTARRERDSSKYRVLCRACNAIVEPNKPRCVMHRGRSLDR